MKQTIHTFLLTPDWKLINEISQVDRFDASWASIEKREGQSLKQLKSIATVRSVGASTRIEGSKMTDDEVEVLITNLTVSKLEERDKQEVFGYFKTLDVISESFKDIDISESKIKGLHNMLLRYSEKDEWHRGNYKQHNNIIEATNPDGSKNIVFQTTNPGFATEDAMKKLIEWYKSDTETPSIVKSALFVYDFLSIHPFQDGNGRLSRLLATLLLLKQGYSWIQYVSFEHEIENRKGEYYKVLMQCQRERPGEDVYPWAAFFLDCLINIQNLLMDKLNIQKNASQMSPREKMIYVFVENHPGCKSGETAEKLKIPLPTVKRILTEMVTNKFLNKYGKGAGTNYSVEAIAPIKKDLVLRLTNNERQKEFTIMNASSFIEITKIILTPLFEWVRPDDWASKLVSQGLCIQVTCYSNNGVTHKHLFMISDYNDPHYFQPVFTLNRPINIPAGLWEKEPYHNEYPIKVTIELLGSVPNFYFDVMVIYDEA
ncbi:MAG TPA: Fic family protein [Chitinophagaceae bacterium]|nr:Fic family protein [Chitinophagaceae bacterium]